MTQITIGTTGTMTRWPCALCGGHTDKDAVLPELEGVGFVCDDCIAAGPELVELRIIEHVMELEEQADELRRLVGGTFEMSTVAELIDARLIDANRYDA